jgi:hypothetical protein
MGRRDAVHGKRRRRAPGAEDDAAWHLFEFGINTYAFPLLMIENLYRGAYELGLIDRTKYDARRRNEEGILPDAKQMFNHD